MKKKFEVWLPLLFAIVMIIGMYIGYRLSATQPTAGLFKQGRRTSLQDAIDIIRFKYVDSVKLDTLEANAIREMMNELDPHSVYLPARDLQLTEEELSGKFEGIGVEYNQIRDTVNITYVLKDGPGEKAGLQIGDQIIQVNDSTIAGKNLTSNTIRSLIRGSEGTSVTLVIKQGNVLKKVSIKRGNIPMPTILSSYMMDTTLGYIKLEKFGSTTYKEFMASLEDLQKQGLKELILDLRGNGGGYMDAAINIADEFLSDDKLIVYTEGTNSPKVEYRCKRPGLFETGKLIVLVDELSASASEILAGSLQDWDRATIIGRRTFGKGLVQEIFTLGDGSALKLTVARYYTPLGRSIQRPYSAGKKVYMDEIWNRFANGQAYFADSNKLSSGPQYKTKSGRILYGGGGIMPDVFVGFDSTSISRDINKLFINGSFSDFVFHYYLDHKSIMDPYTTPRDYINQFDPSKDMWQQFVLWAKKDSVNLSKVPLYERTLILDRMEAYLARFKWRNNGFYHVFNTSDTLIKKAIEYVKK